MGRKKKIVNFLIAQEFLENVAGEAAVDLVKFCERKGRRVTDEELAKALKMKVTEIRTVLNRLHYRGIATYQKTKNNKTGWYAYTWEIKVRRIAELLLEQQLEKIRKLEQAQELEKAYVFFTCKNKCDDVPFEVAAEYQFKCHVCGETMELVDRKKRDKEIKTMLKNLRQEVEELKTIK